MTYDLMDMCKSHKFVVASMNGRSAIAEWTCCSLLYAVNVSAFPSTDFEPGRKTVMPVEMVPVTGCASRPARPGLPLPTDAARRGVSYVEETSGARIGTCQRLRDTLRNQVSDPSLSGALDTVQFAERLSARRGRTASRRKRGAAEGRYGGISHGRERPPRGAETRCARWRCFLGMRKCCSHC